MRNTIFVMLVLLSACATASVNRQFVIGIKKSVVETKRSAEDYGVGIYKEFRDEFAANNFDKAKLISDKLKSDRPWVTSVVTGYTLSKLTDIGSDLSPKSAKEILKKFEVDNSTQKTLALQAFDVYITNKRCDEASDAAYHFDLGVTYLDKAVLCAKDEFKSRQEEVAEIACQHPGTKKLVIDLLESWVVEFENLPTDKREYTTYYTQGSSLSTYSRMILGSVDKYSPMAKVAAMCPLTQKQYSELLEIGLKDKNTEFSKKILDIPGFEKTQANYTAFMAAAAANYQCGQAADVAMKHGASDQAIKDVFLNPKCQHGIWKGFDPTSIPQEKLAWFLDLSLEAKVFAVAGTLANKFAFGSKMYFDRVVREGLDAKAWEDLLVMEPYNGTSQDEYRDYLFSHVLAENEEMVLANLVVTHLVLFSTEGKANTWIERSFLHALFRDQFDMAAEIIAKHLDEGYRVRGIQEAFDGAVKAFGEASDIASKTKILEAARYIANRHGSKLKPTVTLANKTTVAKMYFELNRLKDKQKTQERILACKANKEWQVKCD